MIKVAISQWSKFIIKFKLTAWVDIESEINFYLRVIYKLNSIKAENSISKYQSDQECLKYIKI